MGFNLYTANCLSELARLFGDNIYRQCGDPLAEETVVVGTQGGAVYLNQFLAREYGIAAGLQMPFPQGCCGNMLRKFFPEAETALRRYEALPLTMDIYRLLEEPEELTTGGDSADGRELIEFLGGREARSDREHQLRRWQLSGKLAELYQRYQLTRFDTLEQSLGERWQGRLWQALTAAQPAPVTFYRRLLEWTGPLPAGVPARLSVFGISALPRWYIIFFLKLADLGCEVNFFHLNCCRLYWSDVYSEAECRFRKLDYSPEINPLLASWGRSGRELLDLLVEAEGERPFGGRTEFIDYCDREKEDCALLHLVQQDILDCENRQYGTPALLTDGSLEIHDCPRPRREVEVLRDRLLAEFAAGTLKPHEVLIMAPDIDEYAPHLRAVFDAGPLAGKYTLAGRNAVTAASGFADLLTLDRRPLTLRFAAEWLADPVRAAAAGIALEDWQKLLELLQKNHIVWGLDAEEHLEFAGVSYRENTWQEGLDRILRQYAAGPEGPDGADLEEFAPAESLLTPLGKLITLVQQLAEFRGKLQESRTEAEWMELFAGALDTFFLGTTREEKEELSRFRSGLLTLGNAAGHHGFEVKFTSAVAAEQVAGLLAETGGSYRFLRGKITCCSLGPLRSVPAKAVAVLGLTQGRLPGRDLSCGFDPDPERRTGERSRMAEDRYLFLETLLAAKEKLWLFTTLTTAAGEPAAPAGAAAELIHYLEHSFPGFAAIRHPAMPFDRRLFTGAGGSQDREFYRAAVQLRDRTEPVPALPDYPPFNPDTAAKEVMFGRLRSWVKDPMEFFVEKILKINNARPEPLPEMEPTVPDKLEQYQLWHLVTTRIFAGGGREECRRLLERSGRLLPLEAGRRQFRRLWQLAEDIRDKLPEPLPELRELPVDFTVTPDKDHGLEVPVRVTGGGPLIYTAPDGSIRHLFLRCGKDKPGIRCQIRLEQEAVRMQLSREQLERLRTQYLYIDKDSWRSREFILWDEPNPMIFWRRLVRLYQLAEFRPQLWLEKTAEKILGEAQLVPAAERYQKQIEEDYGESKWLKRLLPLQNGVPPGWEEFAELMLQLRLAEEQK